MQHFADSAACGKRLREEREEPELSLAEPCLADHVQLGFPEHVQLGYEEHVLLFRAVLQEIKECRQAGIKLRSSFRCKTPSFCRQEAHRLESVNVQLDQLFTKAFALSVGIQLELLTPGVSDSQWQPASALERTRVTTNKRLATTAMNRSLASASGHSTPAMRPHAGGSLQHELKQLDSSTAHRAAHRGPYVKTPEQIERTQAAKVVFEEKRRHDAADHPYRPGSDFRPENLADRERLSQEMELLSQVPVCTSRWSGTKQFWDLVALNQLVELDMTSPVMQEHFEITKGGVGGECAVWNVGGNPGYNPGHAYLERGLLARLVKAIGVMVIHSFFVSDCTVFC